MFPYLIIHFPSPPSLGIRKCSRQAEKRVFIPTTTNLFPQNHNAVNKHSWTLNFHLWSGEKASPPLGQAGLYGATLGSSRRKTFWCYWGPYSSWTNYLLKASVWAFLSHQPKSWECDWKNINQKVFTDEYRIFCPGSIFIISSAFFIYT